MNQKPLIIRPNGDLIERHPSLTAGLREPRPARRVADTGEKNSVSLALA